MFLWFVFFRRWRGLIADRSISRLGKISHCSCQTVYKAPIEIIFAGHSQALNIVWGQLFTQTIAQFPATHSGRDHLALSALVGDLNRSETWVKAIKDIRGY